MIVKEICIGNCHFTSDDTYCVKTKDEINNILNTISQIYSDYFTEHPEHLPDDWENR